jgi:hypothetical protein
VSSPNLLLDFFKRGEADRETRLQAAQGVLAPRAQEQVEILLLLLNDADGDIKKAAEETLQQIPHSRLAGYLAGPEVSDRVIAFFAGRGILPDPTAVGPADEESLTVADPESAEVPSVEQVASEKGAPRESAAQQIAMMRFPERLQAAVKGTREMRSLLIRDSNKTISAAVLSSPKLNASEIEAFARMANLPEETLRIIGANRRWTRNYQVIVGLTKNPKTPLAMSLNFLSRLHDRDLQMLSIDRNVPDPLRVAARKKIVASASRR